MGGDAVWGKGWASAGQVSPDREVGPGAPGLGRAGTHTVVGTDGVEGIGTAHKERGFVPKKQHLYKISTLALGLVGGMGKTEAMVGVGPACGRARRRGLGGGEPAGRGRGYGRGEDRKHIRGCGTGSSK